MRRSSYAVGFFVSALAGFAGVCASASDASAAGLYFSDRGVRPVGRGGAFVAGADDLGAIWYNPAGIAFAGETVLFDASWLRFGSSYQRRSLVHNPDTGQDTIQGSNYFPEVKGTSPLIPLPTLAVSNHLGQKDFNFALGVYAPYSALTTYPEENVPFAGRTVPAPQRYSLITLDGSALAVLGAYASWMPSDRVAIGAGFQTLVGKFVSKLAFSACPPDRLICNSEQPDYDATGQLSVGTIVAPSGTLGVIGIVDSTKDSEVRVGASLQLPFWVSSPGTVKLRLPTAPPFDKASVEGDQVHVKFRLPAIVRTGIESRFGEKRQLRMELAFFYEAWSMHDGITLDPSGNGIQLHGVTGFPDPYQVGQMTVPRGFRDTFSIHGGGEYTFDVGGYDLTLRAGANYERSAVPAPYLSVLTVDLDKVQLAFGGSLYVGAKKQLRLDAVYAHTFAFQQDVDPAQAAIGPVKVIRANPVPDQNTVKVNGGIYNAHADIVGVGMSWSY